MSFGPKEQLEQQAAAWHDVYAALDRVCPGWTLREDVKGKTGAQMAVAAVERLAARPEELPLEPTEEMLSAGMECLEFENDKRMLRAAYKAMLSAREPQKQP